MELTTDKVKFAKQAFGLRSDSRHSLTKKVYNTEPDHNLNTLGDISKPQFEQDSQEVNIMTESVDYAQMLDIKDLKTD